MSNETSNHDDYKKLGNGLPENMISTIFFILGGFIILAGLLAGIFLGMDDSSYSTEFSPAIFAMYAVSGVFSGMIFIGIGEIIKQLYNLNIRMHRKGYTLLDKPQTEKNENVS